MNNIFFQDKKRKAAGNPRLFFWLSPDLKLNAEQIKDIFQWEEIPNIGYF